MIAAEQFIEAFRAANHAFYTADFRGAMTDADGKVRPKYVSVNRPPTVEDVARHLAGDQGLLSIPVDNDGRCSFAAIDIDDYELDIKELLRKIGTKNIQCIVARSKSGGAHLFFFFTQPQEARAVRAWLSDVASDLGLVGVEIFPKQERIDKGDFGSGLNMPYRGGAQNVAIGDDGGEMTLEKFFARIEVVRMPSLPSAYASDSSNAARAAARVLLPYWIDSWRNPISYAVQGYLCRKGNPELADAIIAELQSLGGGINVVQSSRVLKDLEKGARVPGLPKLIEHIGDLAGDPTTTQEVISAFQKGCGIKPQDSERTHAQPFAPGVVISAVEFLALTLPERAPLVDGLLYERSLVCIHAWRGIGKTWVALALNRALTTGTAFLHWSVPMKRRCLFIDGEMAARELQDRVRATGPSPPLLELMPSELFFAHEGRGLVLNDTEQQRRFLATLSWLEVQGRRPDVLTFDNLSSLTFGTDENSNSEQDELLAFFRGLRHAGYTVVFVHHDGKSGEQRGATRREDFFDLVVQLKGTQIPSERTGFTVEFTKTRGKRPTPNKFSVALVTDQFGQLALAADRLVAGKDRTAVPEQKEWILLYIIEAKTPVTRADIRDHFDLGKSTANEHVQKLIRAGWLSGESGPLKVTLKGASRLSELWPEKQFL
jgi:hypothetical protein